MTPLVASMSGCNSRGAAGAVIGSSSSSERACRWALSWRTGRVARCTTSTTMSAMAATSNAWRATVAHSICSARAWRSSSVSATWITAMPRPCGEDTGCSSTATRTGWPRNSSS